MMKRLIIAVVLLMGVALSAQGQELKTKLTTCPAGWTAGPDADWKVFWNDALTEARQSGKKIFALSTGSDWCGWCMKLKKDVLTTEEFKAFAKKNLVLLYLDCPRKPLPEGQKQHNDTIRGTLSFGGGVPCAAVFGVDSRRYGVISGYSKTPAEYIARIDEVLAKKGEMPKDGQPPKIFTEGYSESERVASGEKISDAKNQDALKNLSAEALPKKSDEAKNEKRASSAASTNVVKWTYEIVNDGVVLGGRGKLAVPKDTTGGLVIPEKIDGKPVCSIGDYAFHGCSGLKSVTIPSSVTNIGKGVFIGCSGLMSFVVDASNPSYSSRNGLLCSKDGTALVAGVNGDVTIPSSVTNIEYYAFSGCSGLKSMTIPSSVMSIGKYAFADCRGLGSVTIPEGVTSIGNGAFSLCLGLTSVTVPSSVTNIGDGAFLGCRGVESFVVDASNPRYCSLNGLLCSKDGKMLIASVKGKVTIPEGVTSIGNGAFSGRHGLKSVTIPEGVTSIGDYAFSRCIGLESVTILEGVTSIGNSAFSSCHELTSVTIPSSVTSIGDRAFYYCSGLTSVTIPEGLINVVRSAFGFNGTLLPPTNGMATVVFEKPWVGTSAGFRGAAPSLRECRMVKLRQREAEEKAADKSESTVGGTNNVIKADLGRGKTRRVRFSAQ